jgi:MFS family permease
MLQQWMITVGILFAYLVALIIFAIWPASAASSGWRLVLGLGAVPALIGLVLRSRMPESPRWLLRHGKYDQVREAMATLGVQDVSDDDVQRAAEVVERVEGGSREKRRRKPLAIGGYTGMIVFALVTALGLAFMSGTLRLVVIMIGLDFFIAAFAIGVGGTGWTLQGEVFPTAVRGQAASFCAMIDWLANFALIEVFPVTQNAISLAGVMVVFAGLCALAIVFVWKFLPETKELPVEEIVRVFEKQQEESVLHKVA